MYRPPDSGLAAAALKRTAAMYRQPVTVTVSRGPPIVCPVVAQAAWHWNRADGYHMVDVA